MAIVPSNVFNVTVAAAAQAYVPTHYVAPFGSVPGATSDLDEQDAAAFASATSPSTPCSLACAMANATAGHQVQVAPGLYDGGSRPTANWASSFAPANSGTATEPIVFFAEHPAAYNSESPSLLSEIRSTHVASTTTALSTRDGGSDRGKHYVIFDGFFVNEHLTRSGPASGAVGLSGGSEHCEIRRFWFERSDVPPYGDGYNGNAIFPVATRDCRIVDCLFTGTDTLFTNQDSCIELYNCERITIEHNTFRGAGLGVHIKTEHTAHTPYRMEDVVVRFNWCEGSAGGINIQSVRSAFVYQNLVRCDGSQARGIKWSSTSTSSQLYLDGDRCQVQIYNNTVLMDASASYTGPLTIMGAVYIEAGTEIHSNLFRQLRPSEARTVWAPFEGTSWMYDDPSSIDVFDYNLYEDTALRFQFDGTTHSSMSAWRSAIQIYDAGFEVNSIQSTVEFEDESNDDYRLSNNGQAALTASRSGGPVGCYMTGNEAVGRRPSP